MNAKNGDLIGLALGLGVLFVTVYVAGRAWQRGKDGKKSRNYSFSDTSTNVSVRIYPDFGNYSTIATIIYENGTQFNYNLFGYNLDNVTDQLTLYLSGATTQVLYIIKALLGLEGLSWLILKKPMDFGF